jgi:hypothetical protein
MCGLDSSGSGLRSVAGFCENCNEPSGSIKCDNFLTCLHIVISLPHSHVCPSPTLCACITDMLGSYLRGPGPNCLFRDQLHWLRIFVVLFSRYFQTEIIPYIMAGLLQFISVPIHQSELPDRLALSVSPYSSAPMHQPIYLPTTLTQLSRNICVSTCLYSSQCKLKNLLQ